PSKASSSSRSSSLSSSSPSASPGSRFSTAASDLDSRRKSFERFVLRPTPTPRRSKLMDETISKARAGDREAMAALVREHYAAVYRFCVRRLGPDLGQDAAQETF